MSYALQRNKAADSLETRADTMQEQIDQLRAPLTQNWTPRRAGIKDGQRQRAARLERCQDMLRGMAKRLRDNTLPPELVGMTKTKVLSLLEGYNLKAQQKRQLEALKAVEPLGAQMRTPESEADRKKREIERLEEPYRQRKIPGFFPTPTALANKMIDLVVKRLGTDDLEHVLEPSAGLGSILDALQARDDVFFDSLSAVELDYGLQDILRKKGYPVVGGDIMALEATRRFDTILMNPPFERGQAKQHIEHVFENHLSNRMGALCSVVPGDGRTGRNDLSAFLDKYDARIVPLEAGQFTGAGSFKQTGVHTSLLLAFKS